MSDYEGDGGRWESPPIAEEIPFGRLFPYSRKLTTVQLRRIAEGLGLPTTGSADETKQLIEGEGHEVHNIQEVVNEATTVSVTISLMDEGGGVSGC